MIFKFWHTSVGLVRLQIDARPMLGLGLVILNESNNCWGLNLVVGSLELFVELDRNSRYLPPPVTLAHPIRTPLPGSLVLN